jgi:hypothetical protein
VLKEVEMCADHARIFGHAQSLSLETEPHGAEVFHLQSEISLRVAALSSLLFDVKHISTRATQTTVVDMCSSSSKWMSTMA